MPLPSQITAAQTALNRAELALQEMSGLTNRVSNDPLDTPALSRLTQVALQLAADLSEARFNLS